VKSKVVKFERNAGYSRVKTFDFLGFTHFNDKSRKGYYKVGKKTERKRFNRAIKDMNIWLKSIRNLVKVNIWWETLISKMRGHFQYYGLSGNMLSLSRYYFIVVRLVKKWLNRRSQKEKNNWKKFNEYLQRHLLSKSQNISQPLDLIWLKK
jgi:hypothetical protein